jgi:hypothetical protein
MVVNDYQVATMRAFLEGDRARYSELVAQLNQAADSLGYSALLNAAFFEAVDRRFKESQRADVIDYVAEVRSRSADWAAELDPRTAERLIRAVLGEGSTEDITGRVSSSTKLYLLGALMADAHLDSDGLDEFTAKIRKMADYLLRTPGQS